MGLMLITNSSLGIWLESSFDHENVTHSGQCYLVVQVIYKGSVHHMWQTYRLVDGSLKDYMQRVG